MTDQFKRNIAFKLRIGDVLLGKPIFEAEKFLYLEWGEKKISRVNVIGNIVDKYESEGDRKYIFFKLDDGSGQISLKVFGDDVEKFKGVAQGQTVVIIGVLRNWNNETYIQPEIISDKDPKYLLLRKLEIEKNLKKEIKSIGTKEETVAVKDKILNLIKNAEESGGIDTDEIIMKFRDISPEVINQEIKKLLEDGIIFEPRPGRIRYLG
ncbi:MAG: OB-fold nucleic acid binding domain-containing protein [Nanoarchaeota archaeon]|nr:OB-fold nucleic acid binding domain-containing protein [Nanoarchaeota archaeon]